MVLLEYQVGQFHSTGIGSKCALPVLGHIKAVKGSFRPDVLKSYISHVAGASWVRFDESNIVALDDSNVASMLWSVSYLVGAKHGSHRSLTMFEISALTLRLPIETPEPA